MSEFLKDIAPPIGWVTLGAILGILVKHRLDLGKSRVLKHESDIKADKLEFIPLIDGFISKAGSYPAPNIVRRDCIRELQGWQRRFRLHLSGGKLKRFSEAWTALEQTTEQEMVAKNGQGVFTETQADEFRQVSKILTTRLEALRDTVHDT